MIVPVVMKMHESIFQTKNIEEIYHGLIYYNNIYTFKHLRGFFKLQHAIPLLWNTVQRAIVVMKVDWIGFLYLIDYEHLTKGDMSL